MDSSVSPLSLAIRRRAWPLLAARKVWNWSLCSRYGDASSWASGSARTAAFLSPAAAICASASGRLDRLASEAVVPPPAGGAVTGARSAQPRATASAATARIRCNMSPPGESGGSLCGKSRRIHRRFLATLPQNTRDSRAMLALAVDSTYWQQRVAYGIVASLDEPSGVLSGNIRIKYVNQSPDTLRDFYVHQYLNAFRPGSRWAAADSADQRVRV